MLLETHNISVNLGPRQVLDQVSLRITTKSRIGLIGANGAGKSTLLKCLMGEIEPQEGNVSKVANIRVKCLTQNPKLGKGNTLKEELYTVFEEINEIKEREAKLSASLEFADAEELEKILEEIGELQDLLDRLGADQIEARVSRMVTELGFKLEELEHPVDKFSGGWQMRINLAKILLQEADVILMDEPTNHLDLEACEWLEEFLRNYPKGIVLVSHDRYFLNEVVTEIAELERGKLKIYPGNYTDYVDQRLIQREQQAAAAKRQESSLAKQREFVDRFRASAAKSKQAKSRERQLGKVKIIDAPTTELRKLNFKFPLPEPSNNQVLNISNLSKSFGDRELYKNINLKLEWTKEEPQRVFILGANGCGKTTLFKILMGLEEASSGELEFGSRVNLGYYAQHQLQILDPKKTVLQTLEEAMPPTHQTEVRGILGRFLFTGEKVFSNVEVLSGGEKARLAIAKLMVSGPNTLLLDEPTNHLDTSTQEAVENALRAYQGTIISISHDRYLINNLATQIWEFDKGSLVVFKGSYEDYLEKRDMLIEKSRNANGTQEIEAVRTEPTHHELHQAKKAQEKEVKNLEKEVEKLQNKKEKLTKKLQDPKIADDYKKLEGISKEIEEIQKSIDEKEANWLELSNA